MAHSAENSIFRCNVIQRLTLCNWKPVSLHLTFLLSNLFCSTDHKEGYKIATSSSYPFPPMYKLVEKGDSSQYSWIHMSHISIPKSVTVGGGIQYADELVLGYLCYPWDKGPSQEPYKVKWGRGGTWKKSMGIRARIREKIWSVGKTTHVHHMGSI